MHKSSECVGASGQLDDLDIAAEHLDDRQEPLARFTFNDVAGDIEIIGPVLVFIVPGRRQHENRCRAKIGVRAQFRHELQPVHFRHLEIAKHEVRAAKRLAIGRAAENLQCLDAALGADLLVDDARLFQCPLDRHEVSIIIFDNQELDRLQNRFEGVHAAAVPVIAWAVSGQVKVNAAPRSPPDEISIVPP